MTRDRTPSLQRIDPGGGQALAGQPGGELYVKNGDAARRNRKAAKVVEAEYTTNINIHCPLEPMNATAEFKDGILHLYSGNQFMTRSTAIAAGAVGMIPKTSSFIRPGSAAASGAGSTPT